MPAENRNHKHNTVRAVLIVPCTFAGLLVFFFVFRTVLIAIPIEGIDAFQKSGIGTLTAFALLLIQPFGCRVAARRFGASRATTWWVFAGGVLSSVLLFFPALILFME